MIDGPDTTDRDDAVWVEADGDGWTLTVHIADVDAIAPAGGPIDAAARRRVTTRYLAEGHIPMITDGGEARATLREGAVLPTCRVTVRVDSEGHAYEQHVARGTLEDGRILTYPQAAAAVREERDPLHGTLGEAHRLARALLARRRAAGALAFYDLRQGLATTEEGAIVRLGDVQRNAGYVIVQELMIAANEAVARWSVENDVPILFRNHRAAAVAPPRDELIEDLTAMAANAGSRRMVEQRLAMLMRPATYAPTVTGHYALNVPAYTHATSPLRRYPDLVTQRMVFAHADGVAAPYAFGDLVKIGDEVNTVIRERRLRTAERYRSAARKETRRRLEVADYAAMDAETFRRILKLAVTEPSPREGVAEEIVRRLDEGLLPVREVCHVLFDASGDDWRPVRERLGEWLAEEPSRAITGLSVYAQDRVGGPISDAHVRWSVEPTGTAQSPRFTAQVSLHVAGERHASPERTATSKKDARSQAALALVALLAGIADRSVDVGGDEVTPVVRARHVPADRNPVMAANEYAQLGVLTGLRFAYERDGAPHEPVFTCVATAVLSATGEELSGTGTANSKQAAKTAAAAELRARVDAALPVTSG